MKNIKLMNKIAKVGTDVFDCAKYNVSDSCETVDAIMVRSAKLHDMEFPAELKAIARCGAGVNNIPVEKCTEKGVVVFNTPGANANGVKELALCALILAARDVVGGIDWVKENTMVPMLTPRMGMRCRVAALAMCRMVPSPPKQITRSAQFSSRSNREKRISLGRTKDLSTSKGRHIRVSIPASFRIFWAARTVLKPPSR